MPNDISVNHIVRSVPRRTTTRLSPGLQSQLGRHDISAYSNLLGDYNRAKDAEAVLQRQEGANGLVLFSVYDHGALLSIKGSPVRRGNMLSATRSLPPE